MAMAVAEILYDGPQEAALQVALAHGANGPMDTPFLDFFASGIADRGYRVARFEFPYMIRRREDGKKRPPDRADRLADAWRHVIAALAPDGQRERLVIGGKSLGGRIASMVADEAGVGGLVCLGYPFHPPRTPQTLRVEHLRTLRTPTLILQGTRDPFGLPVEIMSYGLPPAVALHWLDDGDHSFAPRKSSGRTLQQNLDDALERVLGFLSALTT